LAGQVLAGQVFAKVMKTGQMVPLMGHTWAHAGSLAFWDDLLSLCSEMQQRLVDLGHVVSGPYLGVTGLQVEATDQAV